MYFPFSIFNLSTTTVVIDSLKLTFPFDTTVFVDVSLTGSNAIFFWPEKRQRLLSLFISIPTKPLAIASMIALQVVRTSFGFYLRECMGSCFPPLPPPPRSRIWLFTYDLRTKWKLLTSLTLIKPIMEFRLAILYSQNFAIEEWALALGTRISGIGWLKGHCHGYFERF